MMASRAWFYYAGDETAAGGVGVKGGGFGGGERALEMAGEL